MTALAVGEINRRDGLADIVVGVGGAQPRVIVFEGADGALRAEPEALAVPAEVTALALGHLDDDYFLDLAAAAGSDLLIVHGRDRNLSLSEREWAAAPPAVVDKHTLSFPITALALGNFSPDENYQLELALLSPDGAVHLLNPTTAETIAQSPIPDFPTSQLLSVKSSSLPADDLLALDPANHQLHILVNSPTPDARFPDFPIPSFVSLDVAGSPAALRAVAGPGGDVI